MAAEAFASGMEKSLGMFSYLNFLFHSTQPDFNDYTGPYPEGLREKIQSLTQLASTVGYEIDFTANISASLATMDGDAFFNMLYDASIEDNPATPGDERIRLAKDQFVSLLEDPKIKEAFTSIATSSIGENPTLGSLLAFEGNTMDFSAFESEDGTLLVNQPIANLKAETIPAFVENMSNENAFTFLSGLPLNNPDDPDDTMTQQNVIDLMAAGLAGEGDDLNFPPGTTLQDAIQARIEHTDEQWFQSTSEAQAKIYDAIRNGISEGLTTRIAATNQGISSGELIGALSGEELYDMLSAKLATEEGRAEVRTALNKQENLDLLRENLAKMDFNTLIALMPNEMVDAQMSNAIRGFLENNGLLQSIIGILHGVFEWAGGFLRDNGFDKLADNLEGARDITSVLRPEAASAYQEQFRGAADPNVQHVHDPSIDPATTQNDVSDPVVVTPEPDAEPTETVSERPIIPPSQRPGGLAGG